MIVLGLTGSIGMGKTTVASQFAELGARTISADAIVHALMGQEGRAIPHLQDHFHSVIENGAVNRRALGEIVYGDEVKLALLEGILHPLVVEEEAKLLERFRREDTHLAVLDIPLLFETKGEKRCDKTVVVTAPRFIQRRRVMKRLHMTPEKFERILGKQMPDLQKRARADFIVQTGLGRAYSMMQVKNIVRQIS